MVTFLVHFGYSPRYVLTRDLISLNAIYGSALRCTYLAKSEDAYVMAASVGEVLRAKRSKSPLKALAKAWNHLINSRTDAGKNETAPGVGNATTFISDFRSGTWGHDLKGH